MPPGPVKSVLRAVSQIDPGDVLEALRHVEQFRAQFATHSQLTPAVATGATDPAADHARTLGLLWPCERAVVVGAFRALAHAHHPDGATPDAAYLQRCVDARAYLLARIP